MLLLLARSTPWILSYVQSSLTLCVCLFGEKRKGGALPVSMAEEYRTGKGGIVRVSFFFFLREGGEGERWVRHF